ncbi:MAG: sugar-binding protein, partial [Pseudomonadota bacterium]
MTRNVIFVCLCLGIALSLRAAEKREYPCYRLAKAPALDGNIDKEEWGDIPEAGGFYILKRDEIASGRLTYFKAGWTPEAIYLAVRCQEPFPEAMQPQTVDGGALWNDDSIEMFFVPTGDKEPVQYIANATGARWQAKGMGNWQAKANVGDEGWTLEIMLPFSLLGKTPSAGERWLFNVARNSPSSYFERFASWPKLEAGFNDVTN